MPLADTWNPSTSHRMRFAAWCVAVKSPGYGDRRKAMMQDIAVLTGGQFLAEELGLKLENTRLDDLGRAQRVVVDKDNTTIIGGGGTKVAIQSRCQDLRKQIDKTTSDYEREKLQERLAKLSGGVAVTRVGAPSDAELKSRKEALDDAISATKAAAAEGVVAGGGLSLLRAIDALSREEACCEGDERTGLRILKRALEAPARQIAEKLRLRRRRRYWPDALQHWQSGVRRRPRGICRPARSWDC